MYIKAPHSIETLTILIISPTRKQPTRYKLSALILMRGKSLPNAQNIARTYTYTCVLIHIYLRIQWVIKSLAPGQAHGHRRLNRWARHVAPMHGKMLSYTGIICSTGVIMYMGYWENACYMYMWYWMNALRMNYCYYVWQCFQGNQLLLFSGEIGSWQHNIVGEVNKRDQNILQHSGLLDPSWILWKVV